jgi:hypothetical protein
LNRGMKDLQSFALPLGHAAVLLKESVLYLLSFFMSMQNFTTWQ